MCDPCQPICCPDICCEPCLPSCDPCCDPCPPMCCPPPSCNPCMPSCDPCCPMPKPCAPKRCKSRELRSSVLMTSCDCVKKNGLQYDCPRRECNGRPCCITKPIPMCCPSRYMWRYANVTMGKSTTIRAPKPNCKPVVSNCNPCVAQSCDECCNTNCC
ncbi:hypothetical protein PVAND_001715 [Polypedilum vanderplanki]|uniref:Uncharacterized protein n=1 Tax=Polypedilum vanderplanki TaxID=319348 RepID=A0A9J6BNR5_POLVA|nr:hypothetical protein PVAND_001715 [Polypedilum vanderplanki]